MKSKIYITLFVSYLISGCGDFLDINTDPNNASESSLQLTLPPGISGTAYIIGGEFQVLGGLWAQHWTQSTGASQYRDYDQYDVNASDFERPYGTLYAESLNDLEYVKLRAESEEEWNYYLISTVMQAYTFQVLADLYGQIPFNEALKKNEDFTPSFNTGQTVYDSLILRIDRALAKDFSSSSLTVPGDDDLLFGGDMDAWRAFAHTLKLKIFLRQSMARPAVAATGISALYGNPENEFLDQHAAMTAFGTGQNQRNPYYETEVSRFGHANIVASNTLLNFLRVNSDPRVDTIFSKIEGDFVGLDQGDFLVTTPANATETSQPIVKPTDPVYLISEAESYFLQAEAALRFPAETGLTDTDAETFYLLGIASSFEKFGTTLDSSLFQPGGPYEWLGTQEEKMELIIVQKWIAMANSQGLEAFLEQLRTGYPDFLTVSVNSVLGPGQFPRRLIFPAVESNRNPDEVPDLVPLTTPIWWDVN